MPSQRKQIIVARLIFAAFSFYWKEKQSYYSVTKVDNYIFFCFSCTEKTSFGGATHCFSIKLILHSNANLVPPGFKLIRAAIFYWPRNERLQSHFLLTAIMIKKNH